MTPTHDRHPCAQYIAELATLRQWDARKPEVQAKVIDLAYERWTSVNDEGPEYCWDEVSRDIRTGKRPALELEE